MATFKFEIEDHELVEILKGDTSFAGLLRDKILNMEDLPDMKEALIEAAKSAVTKQLKDEILTNLFERKQGNFGQWTVLKETASAQINDMIKAEMFAVVRQIIHERDQLTQQKAKEELERRSLDYDKIMLQAAKELLKEAQKSA